MPFHRAVLGEPAFTATNRAGFGVHTSWIETEFAAALASSAAGSSPDVVQVLVGGRLMTVRVPGLVQLPDAEAIRAQARSTRGQAASTGAITAPMQGTVVKVAVEDGQRVAVGDVIAVVEAMKMEIAVTAPRDGTITGLRVSVGDTTPQDASICELL